MKIANIREFRNKATTYLKEDESVLITRHGKITGVFYPITSTDKLPENLQEEVDEHIRTLKISDVKKEILLQLKNKLKVKIEPVKDIKVLQKGWRFKGNLSDELVAERDKR